MSDPKVAYRCQSAVTTLPDGRQYVLVTLTLTCPVCGEIEMQLPGHHLRRVVELLREQLLLHEALTSHHHAETELTELQQMAAEILGDPRKKETTH